MIGKQYFKNEVIKIETEKEIVKIRTLKGRIITLSIIKTTDTHILGDDKFGKPTILAIKDIDSMLPISGDSDE